ncbi:hypothetical protein [Mesorhizobium delmotii]|uniref:Uncharacterized protein n=1 Tax=Mesorhizobium delmotii TaxID=1631247 RepID=A0A2P9ANP3_9HYPH|nr:hypothetical protein [Mesorhizobium delmotii]SJM32735.1 hypothetical protein BQ8482_310056 [Mesorhizobium delmotii]
MMASYAGLSHELALWRWSDGGEIARHVRLFVSGQLEAAAARPSSDFGALVKALGRKIGSKITHIDVNLTP